MGLAADAHRYGLRNQAQVAPVHARNLPQLGVETQSQCRGPARRRAANNDSVCGAPAEIILPLLVARVEQRHVSARTRILSNRSRMFGCVASATGQRKVVQSAGASGASGNDMFQFERVAEHDLCCATVFAAVLRPAGDERVQAGQPKRKLVAANGR